MKKILRLGSRGSPLALIQARNCAEKLIEAHPGLTQCEIEIVPIRTSGDWRPEQKERMFLETGGDKGLFTKEIEEALLTGHIDMAVHSMKDVPSLLPDGLEIAAMLERADPRDAFLSSIAPQRWPIYRRVPPSAPPACGGRRNFSRNCGPISSV